LSEGDTARIKPSIDILFDSIAMCFESKAVGVLLPGSTIDGAEGLLEIRKAGGYTIVQDESDSPDPTLTREAVRLEAAMVSTWGDRVSEVLLDALAIGTPSLPKSEAPSGTLIEGEGPKILIVDDSPTIRALVRYHMRALGLSNFSEAKNGMSAWQMIVSALNDGVPYSLVISDQNMPEMLGLELLQKIRAHEKLKSLPFILVTTMSDRASVVKAIQVGINDFITKPMSAQVLAEKVKAIFSRSDAPPTNLKKEPIGHE
jgi:two-component system chemotaxis response regulator CheY